MMSTYNSSIQLTQKETDNVLGFVEELIELENKYHVKIDSDYFEDYDYDYDDNPILCGIESVVLILNNDCRVLCRLQSIRDELEEEE